MSNAERLLLLFLIKMCVKSRRAHTSVSLIKYCDAFVTKGKYGATRTLMSSLTLVTASRDHICKSSTIL